jgi:hypothetical protein
MTPPRRLPVVCPAGEAIAPPGAGLGCRCHIEQINLDSDRDRTTLAKFCLHRYTDCPTWRSAKEAEWENRSNQFIEEIAA